MYLILKLLLNITVSSSLSYDDFYDFDDPLLYDPTYREIFLNKITEIASKGFTIEEFQKAMVLLCLLRFMIYSIKYNIITSFKICAIGLFSCILWGIALLVCCAHESRGKSRGNTVCRDLVVFPTIWSEPFVLNFFC